MNAYKTEQETFWSGEFGDNYVDRNKNAQILAGDVNLFSSILKNTRNVKSVIEFGANIGLNLIAIKTLLPNVDISAVELNRKAVEELKMIEHLKVYNQSILEFKTDFERDFVLVKTVLIHINPDILPLVYRLLYKTSKKYLCIAEYYNPKPVAIEYRGHKDKLFKRDFAGEILDLFPDLKLVDYGFTYHRDNYNEYADLNWFLLEK